MLGGGGKVRCHTAVVDFLGGRSFLGIGGLSDPHLGGKTGEHLGVSGAVRCSELRLYGSFFVMS
jgi:hypothetical protein